MNYYNHSVKQAQVVHSIDVGLNLAYAVSPNEATIAPLQRGPSLPVNVLPQQIPNTSPVSEAKSFRPAGKVVYASTP